MPKHTPTDIKLQQASKNLCLSFEDGASFNLSCEFLRVHSPSAEVRGHSPDQAVLQLDKQNVNISDIEAVGNYAVKLIFDDGHDTGLYTWDYLYDLGARHDEYWQHYLDALSAAGHERHEPDGNTG